MSKLYDGDVVAWADEQAALLRSGRLEQIDRLNIAEEIEDVAKGLIEVYEDAVHLAARETGLDEFPDTCLWTIPQIRNPDFLPG